MLKINEIFYSLEGEGQWQGYPTIFIRLSGCNLKCKWCDTAHEKFEEMKTDQILRKVMNFPSKRVKITGGEPLIQELELEPLIDTLKQEGYIIALETNGTIFNHNIFNKVDLICMDIKTPSSYEKSSFNVFDITANKHNNKTEFKMVISDSHDLNFVEDVWGNTLIDNMVLMPNSLKKEEYNLFNLVEEIKTKFPECRYGLRLHEVLELQ